MKTHVIRNGWHATCTLTNEMTRRELNLAIFQGTADRVLWQPRIEMWLNHHMGRDSLPQRFRGMSNLQIYDALGCSMRYAASAGIDRYEARDDLVRIEEQHPDHTVCTVRTPAGEITTVHQDVWEEDRRVNHRIAKYPVTTVRDLEVAGDLVERQRFRANLQEFQEHARAVGDRAEPTLFTWSSGFTELIKLWCGMENTFYLLHDHPKEVEAFLEVCDRREDRLLDEAFKLPCRIFNLGDHATNEFTPPPIFEKFLLPRYKRISERMHEEGRFVHAHWDGNSRQILPFLPDTGLDGVEALTPAPMGDMTLEQIKEAVQDRIVALDLLPAIDFLPDHPLEELLEFTRRVIDMFAPRLVLGVSDEMSQVGQIERIEEISALVDDLCGLAA